MQPIWIAYNFSCVILQGKQSGHKCCEDNPLLKNIDWSDPIENWGESKRCCMSATHLRKLSDVDDKLTTADYVKVDQEVGKLAKDKQEVRLYLN